MTTITDIDPESNGLIEPVDEEPTVRHADSDGTAFETLASETARQLVSTLAESTATTSELAAVTDTSIQNAQYHLDRLRSVGLVEPVGVAYSSRGNEMDVYGLSGSPIVFVFGDVTPEELAEGLRRRDASSE